MDQTRTNYDRPSDVVLAHYGIPGMKWGKRKSGKSSSEANTLDDKKSADYSKVEKHKATIKTSGIKALNNKELQDVVARINLEQQYSKLNGQPKVKAGRDATKKIISDSVKQMAGQYAKKGMEYGIATAAAAAAAYAFEQKRKTAIPGLLAIEAPKNQNKKK